MYINITDSETGNNKGSCAALVNYLEKENKLPENETKNEFWFNGINSEIRPQEVRVNIDNNIAKLGRNDAKFYLINISPSQKEIQFLTSKFGELNDEELMKNFAVKVMDEYAKNFKRTKIESNSDLMWYGKLEHFRYYGHTDLEVKNGIHKKGERKEGEQMHIQVIVSRKDMANKIKLSPMNNSRGRNAAHSAKLGQFNRKAFKQSGESLFDNMFGFERNLKDSMNYAVTMKNGSSQQKKELYLLENNSFEANIAGKTIKGSEHGLEEIINTTHQLSEGLFNLLNMDSMNYEDSVDQIPNQKIKRKRKKRNL